MKRGSGWEERRSVRKNLERKREDKKSKKGKEYGEE